MQETDQSFLLRCPSFPPMSCVKLSGSLSRNFKKCHSLNQPILFSRKCIPIAITLSFFMSLTFLGCKWEQFSLVHSRPLHVKSTHTNSAIPLGKTSEAFMSGLKRKNIPMSLTLRLGASATERRGFFKRWFARALSFPSGWRWRWRRRRRRRRRGRIWQRRRRESQGGGLAAVSLYGKKTLPKFRLSIALLNS